MNDELKKKAYLEAQKLRNAGHSFETILARLDKMGIPEELAEQVVKNLAIQYIKNVETETRPFYNLALFRIGVGVVLAVVFYLIVPNLIILPVVFIGVGIAMAYDMKPL
jgi:uncharacterized membrane protein